MDFLALSQAPPALAIKRAKRTPVKVAPANIPPRAFLPRRKPTKTGAEIAVKPGAIISLRDAVVAIATQR